MLTEKRLSEIDQRVNRASPGPWIWNRMTRDMLPRIENEDGDRKELWWTESDDNFTAHARTDVPDLLKEVRDGREAALAAVMGLRSDDPRDSYHNATIGHIAAALGNLWGWPAEKMNEVCGKKPELPC